jgi:hypothetical protein
MKDFHPRGVSLVHGLKLRDLVCKTVCGNAMLWVLSPALTPINGVPDFNRPLAI